MANELLWPFEQLQVMIDDLQEKGQVIFYGPPGTGKTYVAWEMAKQCRLNGGEFAIVQFHPSYSYEDFVEGFRPRLFEGQPVEGFTWVLQPTSYIGTVRLGNLSVVVRPKIPIDRVTFLIAYVLDLMKSLSDHSDLSPDSEILESIIPAFVHHTHQAVRRGLLQGYRREEEALHTIRGRIRFNAQINRRFGVPMPLEVSFDEFTENIEENRLLKTALHRLAHLPVRPAQARREIHALRPVFNTVELGTYRRGVPEVQYTRLNSHYRPAVELAQLIIDNSSLELFRGEVAGASFLLDMNRVFEGFLFVALREKLGLSASEWVHKRLFLDEADAIRLEPDLSWWNGGRCRFVGDAKYKRPPQGFQHADIYQMLAYCTAANLPSELLVYAAGEAEPGIHRIKHAGKTIEVVSLDISGPPETILVGVCRIAQRVRSLAALV